MPTLRERYLASLTADTSLPVIVRQPRQVDLVLDLAADARERDTTDWPGMTYENGIEAMYNWLTGLQDDPPLGAG